MDRRDDGSNHERSALNYGRRRRIPSSGRSIQPQALTFDVLPTDLLTFRLEFISRHSNVGYFAGPGGTTSPDGWQGTPGTFVPDLIKHENGLTFSIHWRT